MTTQTDKRQYTLAELLTRLGLDYDDSRNKMDCPFCGARRKINLDFDNNFWRCPKCDSKGGVLHFYARYCLGMETLPYRKAERGEVAKKLREYMDGDCEAPRKAPPPRPKKETICVANDDLLHRAYSAMSQIPALQLLSRHKEELLRRGLSEDAIACNGYRSIPEQMVVPDCYDRMYEEAGGETRRSKTLGWLSAKSIRFGLMIAHCLTSKGIDLNGIPGFFKFGQFWCFWCVPGILIPSRNIKGQIVVWQVRKEHLRKKGEAKYITAASRGLPGHVTESVSRCHFPIGNASIADDVQIIVTEGPLKADIACHLFGKPVCFVAIPGITTTKDLIAHTTIFAANGKKTVFNGLDMDRLTNPHVRRGSDELAAAFKKCGITFKDMYWGTAYAASRYMALSLVARCHKVPVKFYPSENVYEKLRRVAVALEGAGVVTCFSECNSKGETETCHWDPATKGIDDYLLHAG